MTKHLNHPLSLLIIFLVWGYLMGPFTNSWFPQTADGEYYSARLAGFYTAIQNGQIPPRWAPTLFSGLGSPVFNFNYPIPNIFGSLFISLGSSLETAMKLTIVVPFLAGGIGIYFLFQKLFHHPLSALVGSLLYLTAPYQMHDIFHRATTGEIMMFGLLPYVLMILPKTAQRKFPPAWAALIYGVYFLTHNLYTLMFLPLIVAFIANFYGLAVFRQNAKPILAGLLISLFFWLPALWEMKYTVLSTAWINQIGYSTELLSLQQTLKLPGHYLVKNDPPTHDSNQPGFAQLFCWLAALIILAIKPKSWPAKLSRFAVISLGFFVVGLFLMTQASLPVWQTFSLIRFIQHPIRLLFIPVFFGAYLGAFIIDQLKIRWGIAVILVFLTAYNYRFFAYRPVQYMPIEDGHYYNYPLSTAANNEFDPIWYNRHEVNQFLLTYDLVPAIATPAADIKVINDGLFTHHYQISAATPTTIIEQTLFFPGWQTTVDDQPVDLMTTAGRHHGLINYDVTRGDHTIVTRFTQATPARFIGNSLSLLGLGWALTLRRKPK